MAMLDKDNLTYKKRLVGNAAAKLAERTLITLERSQKLDLLIHLLANLRQALVVCGPEGIGKTTLLQILQDKRKDQWQICLLQGSSALSFEAIANNLSRFLNLGGSSMGFDLASLRAYCEKQKVVLIIDDAGELVPGLIGELVDFADSLSSLRLVFSMTYDEFHIKSASDKAVDDCHVIELPPLNQKQCAEYLQNLSAQPGALVSFNAVTDSLVEDLYRETHGIPGKILAEMPKLNQYQSRKKGRTGLWLGVAGIVLVAGWTMKALLPSTPTSETKSEKRPEPTAVQAPVPPDTTDIKTIAPTVPVPAPSMLQEQYPSPTAQTEPASPGFLETPVPKPAPPEPPVSAKTPDISVVTHKPVAPEASVTLPTTQTPQFPVAKTEAPATVNQTSEAKTPAPPVSAKAPETAVAVTPKQAAREASVTPQAIQTPEQPAAKTEAPTGVNQTSESKLPAAAVEAVSIAPEQKPASDLDWITVQPPNNYTIQLMVLSSKDSVNRFLKKYAEYRDNLKYYSIGQYDQEKYVLIYGSFQSASDAIKRKATMPPEFQNGLEKRFKAIQNQIRR